MFTLWSPVCLGHACPPGILQIGTAALLSFFVCLVQFHLEFCVFEQSFSVAQGGLEFMLLLPQLPVFWDQSYVPPCLAYSVSPHGKENQM